MVPLGNIEMSKHRVDVEFVQALQQARRVINNLPLEDIEWYENGKPVLVKEENIEQFRFSGLSNIDFVQTNFWNTRKLT